MTTPKDANQPLSRLSWQLQIKLKRDTRRPPNTPEVYDVELLLDNPASQGMSSPVSGEAEFNLRELAKLRLNLDKYGQALATSLFRDPQIRNRYQSALSKAADANVDLRITVFIDPSAPELHALVWELLADPETGARIAENQTTPFSRFLYAGDLPEIPALRKENVRALIAVPNPTDIESSGTSKIQVLENIKLAAAALQGLEVRVMCKPHDPDPSKGPIDPEQAELAAALQNLKATIIPHAVTVDNLVAAINDGVDLLYLVCHGHVIIPNDKADPAHFKAGFGPELAEATARQIGSPVLWLEKEDNDRELVSVPGGELARRIANLGQRPGIRLAVLASCESAGSEHDDTGVSAQAALAPRLAQAGVPTIVAMQGEISMDTAAAFMEFLLANVARHGSVDRAMAAARTEVGDRPDCWMPALFSRLKNGRLWYEAGFPPEATDRIKSIADQLVVNECTPFVGWGLAKKIYGTPKDISQRLANSKSVPFFGQRQGELALVSQYLYTTSGDVTAIKDVTDSMFKQMKANLDERLIGEFTDIDDIVSHIYSENEAENESPDPFQSELEAFRTIARLPSTVFINACPDRLLEEALLAEGKEPIILTPHWRKDIVPKYGDALEPSEMKPLLLYVFGHFADPKGLVLWEDRYLNFLMGIAQNQELIPEVVKNAFTNNTLMFLGFSLDDWNFRVLFRIVNFLLPGGEAQRNKPNVAVQVEPDGTLFTGPDEANDFLKRFYAPAQIEPYWGTSSDFLNDLWPAVEAGLQKKKEKEEKEKENAEKRKRRKADAR